MNSERQQEDKKNEQVFKNMAMTFSAEGITKDIQEILIKKMNYHVRILKELNGIINSLAMSKDKSVVNHLLGKGNLTEFIAGAYKEYELISGSTNIVLSELLKNKKFIINDTNGAKE